MSFLSMLLDFIIKEKVLLNLRLLLITGWKTHANKCSKKGDLDRAEALVREMEVEGIDAPINLYHSMMDGYTKVGEEEKCLTVFKRLKVCLATKFLVTFL